MDIRRVPLWESRNATYMSNDLVRVVIEDQGDVTLELSAQNVQGGRVNALCLPYFRGIGQGVNSDPNYDWYKGKNSHYQAGGIYISFPSSAEEHILTSNTYWIVRRYGSDSDFGGVWRLSEMKSREEGNRYRIRKIDLLVPGHPVLYTYTRIDNLGENELECNLAVHSMLGSPFIESGSSFYSVAGNFVAFSPNVREVAFNRLKPGRQFTDIRHAPSQNDVSMDASYIPGPTGTYDYIMGNIDRRNDLGWSCVINPRQQLLYMTFFPSVGSDLSEEFLRLPRVDFAMNYCGRMDSPWALYDGATPLVFSLTSGFGFMDSHAALEGEDHLVLPVGASRVLLSGQAFTSYDNPRIGSGFYSLDKSEHGLVCKRTKSYAYIQCDYEFRIIRQLADRILNDTD